MHIPLRMCVSCRQMKAQNELIRAVRDKESGKVMLDTEKKLMGRGAYVCGKEECIEKAKKKKAFAKHFNCAVGDEIYDAALIYMKSLRVEKKG